MSAGAKTKKTVTLFVVFCLLGLLAVGSVALARGSLHAVEGVGEASTSSQAIGAFRQAAEPGDALPPTAVHVLDQSGSRAVWQPTLSRNVTISDSGTLSFLVPAAGGVCVAEVEPAAASLSCASLEEVLDEGVFTLTYRGGDAYAISGVMPDGVAEVTLELADRGRVSAAVVDNFFRIEEDSARPRLVRWEVHGRSISRDVDLDFLLTVDQEEEGA